MRLDKVPLSAWLKYKVDYFWDLPIDLNVDWGRFLLHNECCLLVFHLLEFLAEKTGTKVRNGLVCLVSLISLM